MKSTLKTATIARTDIASIALVFLMGATMVFMAGFAQSQTLHDAAHDVRHAAGFPCH